MTMAATGLDLNGICVTRGSTQILERIDMCVGRGQFVSVIGPNGAGKSTLLRSIARAVTPNAGEIHLDGDDLLRMPIGALARRVAVLAQEHPPDVEFTVHEMVTLGRIPHRTALSGITTSERAIIMHALEQVGMAGRAHRGFSSLSGGERTRVLLARAMAQQPDYLLLDEPTNHLDIRYQLELIELVRGLGVTVVAALHDLNLAAAHSDVIVMLADGRVHTTGAPAEVLTPANILAVFEVATTVVAHPDHGRPQLLFGLPHGTSARVAS